MLLGLQPRFNLAHVLRGECNLEDVIITGPRGLQVVPASSVVRKMAELSAGEHAGLIRAFSDLYHNLDILLIDTAAGISDSVTTFAQLLSRGRVGKGNPLLLGFDVETGGELVGSWLDLYSTIVSGLPGSGKTTSQRFLACQTALQGARFAICDPHAGAADDSLAATLAPLSAA